MAGPAISYATVQQPQARWVKDGDSHILYDGAIIVAKLNKRGWAVPKDNDWHALDLQASLREASTSSGWRQVREGVEQSSDGKGIRFQSRGRWIEVY
ncbi:MAG: hypothetical protein FJ271_14580 [Planctomycetes bacterium]|nr:hypothetical protein [Planctomycetota bacterium]